MAVGWEMANALAETGSKMYAPAPASRRPAHGSTEYRRLYHSLFPRTAIVLHGSYTQATMASTPDRQELIRNAVIFLADPKARVLHLPNEEWGC